MGLAWELILIEMGKRGQQDSCPGLNPWTWTYPKWCIICRAELLTNQKKKEGKAEDQRIALFDYNILKKYYKNKYHFENF